MKISEQTRSSTGSGSENYEKISDSMKKKFCLKELIFSFYHITRLALSLTIIILISQTSLKTTKQTEPYLRIQQNLNLWQKYVIVDMITVSTYNCPKGYQPYTSARWEGTKEGCLCKTSLNQYDYVHVLPCTMKLMNAGCTRVDPEKSIPFVFWKTQKLVCVKRINGLNFYTNLTQTLNPSQIQTCSKNTNYETISLSAQPCPITSITNTTTHPNILPDLNFSFIRQTSYPIIDIKMSEYSFCQEYNRANISPNRFQNYDLQIVEISNCGDDGDMRVNEVDQITEKRLFQNNRRIMDVITYVLPAYPRPTDKYVYKLGTVQYPAWTKSCRESPDYNLLKTKSSFQFDQTISKAQSCLSLTIVMILIWGLVYSLICITKRIIQIRSDYKKGILCYPKYIILRIDPNLLNNKLTLSIFSQMILFLFLLAIAIGLLVQIGVQYEYVSGVQEWMRGSYGCMDNRGYFQKWVREAYVGRLQELIRMYLICLLAGLVGVVIDIVFLAWRFNRGDLSAQKIENIFKNDDLEQKNSDQKIQIQDDNINEKQQNADVIIPQDGSVQDDDNIEMDYVNEKDYSKNLRDDSEQNDDPFKYRQKTQQIDIQQIQPNQKQSQHITQKKPKPTLQKNNTTNPSRPRKNTSIHNPTQQSLAVMKEQDDLQFNQINMQSSYRRERKLPRNNKRRLQSLDILGDD